MCKTLLLHKLQKTQATDYSVAFFVPLYPDTRISREEDFDE